MNEAPGEWSAAAAGGRKRRRSISAAVEKPEGMRKPERFFGYRKAEPQSRDPACPAGQVESFSRFFRRFFSALLICAFFLSKIYIDMQINWLEIY